MRKRAERVACLFFREISPDTEIREFAEACLRFTPQIAVRRPEAIFLEIGGSHRHFSEESLPYRIQALAKRFALAPEIKIADDVPSALAMARFQVDRFDALPLEAMTDFISPFRFNFNLYKEAEKTVSTLRMLGLTSLADFSQLPPKSIASRFGLEGVELGMRIRRSKFLPWPRFTPTEKTYERKLLHESVTHTPVATLEPILFLLRGMVDRSLARLRGRCLRASTVSVAVEVEKYSTVQKAQREWRIELPLPQSTATGLLPILRDRLSAELQRSPLEAPVTSLLFKVEATTPGHGAQRNFFNRREEESENWNTLLGRLTTQLGKDRAFSAQAVSRHLPEKSWRRSIEELTHAATCSSTEKLSELSYPSGGALPARPLRLLKKPLPLKQIDSFLILSSELIQSSRAQSWKTLKWIGPERISGEWWTAIENSSLKRGFAREYFQVLTQGGQRLWVFFSPLWNPQTLSFQSHPYLHGFFD